MWFGQHVCEAANFCAKTDSWLTWRELLFVEIAYKSVLLTNISAKLLILIHLGFDSLVKC